MCYVYAMINDRLKGNVDAVTRTSPPSSTNSDTFFSRFGRVASSSWGGAWKYICLVGVDREGFLIWLRTLIVSMCGSNGHGEKSSHGLLLRQHLNQLFDSRLPTYWYLQGLPAANWTVVTPLVLERVRVYPLSTNQHEVIIEICSRTGCDLECFVTT